MKAQIVSFHCVLKDKLGQVISSSFNSEVINQLEKDGDFLRGLVAGLQDVKTGERRKIHVSADQAYGLYDPELVVEVPRRELQQGRQLGIGNEIVTRSTEDGHTRVFRVVNTAVDYVVLDGNHPLAGQDLIFEIEVTAAREASAEDLVKDELTKEEKQLSPAPPQKRPAVLRRNVH